VGPASRTKVELFAIRVEDYPPSPRGWAPVGDLRHAPKVIAKAEGTFTFTGLEPAATYRLAVGGYDWGFVRPVFLSAGDTGVGVPLERLLHFVVEVRDIEGSAPLPRFVTTLFDPTGEVHSRFEGHEGRVEHRGVHPDQTPPHPPLNLGRREADRLRRALPGLEKVLHPLDLADLAGEPRPTWRLVVEAEGYLAATAEPSGFRRVFLQRLREPNLVLLVEDEDGHPCDGQLEGTFEAAEQPRGGYGCRGPGKLRACTSTWTCRRMAS
jgi:hypothetical protein